MKIGKIGNAGLIDELHITIRDKYGNIKKDYTVTRSVWYRLMKKLGIYHNSITYKGMNATAALIIGEAIDPFIWMDIGTGTNAANNAQTALQTTLLTSKRANCSNIGSVGLVKTDSSSTDNETCQWVHEFSKANDPDLTGTSDVVTEVGIFNGDVGSGVMLLRITWAGDTMNWNAGDTLTLTIKTQVKQGA